jgi:hypothetical protein
MLTTLKIEGYQPTPDSPAQNVDYWNIVGNDYFKTMKDSFVRGAHPLSRRTIILTR